MAENFVFPLLEVFGIFQQDSACITSFQHWVRGLQAVRLGEVSWLVCT